MKVMSVQKSLSLYGGASASRAESVATELRNIGILPKGGRGPHAPEITEAQAACFAACVAGADRVSDTGDTALAFMKLVNREGVALALVLSSSIGGVPTYGKIHAIRVMPNCASAETSYFTDDGRQVVDYFAPPEKWTSDYLPQMDGAGFAGRIGHIGCGVIGQLALEAAAQVEAETVAA